jgi:hypothetical protein
VWVAAAMAATGVIFALLAPPRPRPADLPRPGTTVAPASAVEAG